MIENLVMTLMPNFKRLSGEFLHCLHDTFVMIGVSGTIAWFLGVILGIILVTTKKNGILDNKIVFTIANKVIDILRSIPFIILMVLLIPSQDSLQAQVLVFSDHLQLQYSVQYHSLLDKLNQYSLMRIKVLLKQLTLWAFQNQRSSFQYI